MWTASSEQAMDLQVVTMDGIDQGKENERQQGKALMKPFLVNGSFPAAPPYCYYKSTLHTHCSAETVHVCRHLIIRGLEGMWGRETSILEIRPSHPPVINTTPGNFT